MIFPIIKSPVKRQFVNSGFFYQLFDGYSNTHKDDIQFYKFFLDTYFSRNLHFLSFNQLYRFVVFELYRRLVHRKRYGEALYYYYTIPFYFRDEAGRLQIRYDVEEIKRQLYIQTFHAVQNSIDKLNILYYDSCVYRMMDSDISAVIPEKKLYFLMDGSIQECKANILSNYHLVIIHSDQTIESIELIKTLKAKSMTADLPVCLYVDSLQKATDIFRARTVRSKSTYLVCNKQMLYAVLHMVLWNAGFIQEQE